jgi:hypothetical protein
MVKGGTKQKSIADLETSFARFMRTEPRVVAARARYIKKKASEAEPVERKTRTRARPKAAVRYANTPPHLREWLMFVDRVQHANPDMARKDILELASTKWQAEGRRIQSD